MCNDISHLSKGVKVYIFLLAIWLYPVINHMKGEQKKLPDS